MQNRLRERLLELDSTTLQAIMPSWYFEAADMVEKNPTLYSGYNPSTLAVLKFSAATFTAEKTQPVDLMAVVLLNALEVFGALELAGLNFCTCCRSIHSEDTRDHEQTCQGVLE